MSDIVKWDPFKSVTRLYEDFDNLFTEFLTKFSQEFNNAKRETSNISLIVSDKGDEIIISGDIPNAIKDSVDVALRSDSVIISGETSHGIPEEGTKEYSWSKFAKIYMLPVKVNSKAAKVSLENGKLIVRVPKA